MVNFHHQPLSGLPKKTLTASVAIQWTSGVTFSLSTAKLKQLFLLILSWILDASNTAVRVLLQQFIQGHRIRHGFFSPKLKGPDTRYSVFGRELFAIFLDISHIRHVLVVTTFSGVTDHKALIYAFHGILSTYSDREIGDLAFISEFTVDIRHTIGAYNVAADAISMFKLHSAKHALYRKSRNNNKTCIVNRRY